MIQQSHIPLRILATMIFALLISIGAAPSAHAHPLGNFSLNHHDGLRLSPDGIEDTAIVDSAEIPTAQDREKTDANDDGNVSRGEADVRAEQRCTRLAEASSMTVDSRRSAWRVRSSRLTYGEGTAGLPIARLACRLHADADLSRPTTITFDSCADRSRTGWKEITATAGSGVRLPASSVPARSASAGLRRYPSGAADEPLNRTTASLRTQPAEAGRSSNDTDEAASGAAPSIAAGASLFPSLERQLSTLTTSRDLTLPVGLLGVLLTVLLGAGHAALPGHAKLAVAACLARNRGGVRAAVAVGATVTATHTTGVLIVGLTLTLSGSLLGDQLLGWLGTISGMLIASIGTWLVITSVRAFNTGSPSTPWHHHDHVHAHSHEHPHPRTEERRQAPRLPSLLGVGLAGGLVPSPSALVVLLGAVSLSHTFFGVLLVLGYGLGMAATLTAAGLMLSGGANRLTRLAERRLPAWSRYTRYGTLLTALAVLTVGLGLTLRSLPPL